jgi:NAD(P)H-nitrite reductase large subunit
MGCEQEYDPSNKYFIPVRSDKFETTVPNIFAVGDCAGIRGVEVALIEGRLAGITIADRLGRLSHTYVKKSRSQLEKRLLRLLRFHTSIDSLFVSPSNYFSLLTDDTVICRCEEVTLGELRSYMNQGITDLNTLKSLTRIGMGRCQGRNCFPTFAHLVAEEQKVSVASLQIPRTRSPLKPVCIGDVIRCELPECDLPEMKQP